MNEHDRISAVQIFPQKQGVAPSRMDQTLYTIYISVVGGQEGDHGECSVLGGRS